jgi:hypothetical protein
MMMLAKPSVAIGFGLFFLCAVACTHSDEMLSNPLSVVPDWAAGFVLVAGAIANRRSSVDGRTYQVAAWAFMVSLLFGSFVGNFEEWLSTSTERRPGLVSLAPGSYLASIGVMCLFALGGLIGSVRAATGSATHP